MRTALITGASRGIGKAIAAELEKQGWNLLLPTRTELNLADNPSVDRFCRGIAGTTVDLLVNNAGINYIHPFPEIPEEQWEEMLQVNLTAPRKLIQAVLPAMAAQGWGRIVNISSILSLVSREKRAAYSATKSAINALTRTTAIEFGRQGILINAVCPGYIETEMTRINNTPEDLAAVCETIPLGRLAEPEEIAKVVVFLGSEQNSYITGQTIVADGGFTCR